MTTYSSYEAAKIANPAAVIYEFESCFSVFKTVGSKECNPADHCITNNKFLSDGKRIVRGDIVLDDERVVVVSDHHDIETYNESVRGEGTTFILRAAALEDKPKRIKVEYESVNTGDEIITYRNDIFFKHDSGDYVSIENHTLRSVLNHMDNDNLFRRIETEIDERQEFIDAAFIIAQECDTEDDAEWMGKLYDSGKFKLVEGE